jgi:hypothetical protein
VSCIDSITIVPNNNFVDAAAVRPRKADVKIQDLTVAKAVKSGTVQKKTECPHIVTSVTFHCAKSQDAKEG